MRLGEATWQEVRSAASRGRDDDGTLSPILLIPVGYPAEDARVPDISKNPLEEILTRV